KAGPVFEGRPVPSKTPGHFETTRPVAVPNNTADFLESAFGTAFQGNRFVAQTRKWSNAAKSLKLIGSAFQHADFLTRDFFTAFGPTGIREGAPIRIPSLIGHLFDVQFRPGAQRALRRELLNGKFTGGGRTIPYRTVMEEGWSIRGDLSLIKRELTNFTNDPQVTRGLAGKSLDNIRKVNDYWQTGLFDGVYRQSQKYALDEFILPWLIRTRKGASDRQIAAEAAETVNIMYSTLGNWQTILKNPTVKELAHTMMFSTNESEALVRSAISAVTRQPNSGLFREWYLGGFIFMTLAANAINFAATGKPLDKSQYSPISTNDPYSSWFGMDGVGYNNTFFAPVIPFVKGRNGQQVHMDMVGQMDTAFRWLLNPVDAFAARVNVIPRAGYNQVKGETFFGEKLDTPLKRITQLAVDLALPIGPTSIVGAAREAIPEVQEFLPETEGRLGITAQLIQAGGVNLRGEPTIELLNRAAMDSPGKPYLDLNPEQRAEIRSRPEIEKELGRRNEAALVRESVVSVYLNKRTDINGGYRNEENAGLIDKLADEVGMSRDYRERLATLHDRRRRDLLAHETADESAEAILALQDSSPFTSAEDRAEVAWIELFDQINSETGRPGLEDPVTGEWNFKKAEENRQQIIGEFGPEIAASVEAKWRQKFTAFEAHLWESRQILSDNYWVITDQEMAASGLTDLYEESLDKGRLDRQGFNDLHPELGRALLRADEAKSQFRAANPAMERLLYAWDYIDTPVSRVVLNEVEELRNRQNGVIQDRSGIFGIAEQFGNDVLLGAP
ncbi:hypothetical protein LCGC14_1125110, partial [marine sediment metagenome]